MASTRRARRPHLACDNCRRKKIRCPGERPACSTCSRLHQICCYSTAAELGENSVPRQHGLEGRVAQLEERVHQMMGSRDRQTSTYPTPAASRRLPSPRPPAQVVAEAIELYFQYCHRQPLWLFERGDIARPSHCSDELIFSVLSIAIRFSDHPYFANRAGIAAQEYSEIARGNIMFQIAQGMVQLSTIQSLCLLSFANFVANDTHLAWLHLGMVKSFVLCADMHVEHVEDHGHTQSPELEVKRKVFYTIHLLDQLYGPRPMRLNLLDDINNPKYMGWKRDRQSDLEDPPPLTPLEASSDSEAYRGGIWMYMVQQSSLWREVRDYIARCAGASPQPPPWSPDSGYVAIGAQLMDLETRFPTCHRYDTVRFADRTPEELQRSRHYWSPWLYIQFGYHAIHCILNHPFLYSSRPQQSTQMTVPNTFWKTSSEQALIHAAWIVRLIDLVIERRYQVSDPFIGHCASIAATIHIYYCRAADPRVRDAAQRKLNKCMRFLAGMASIWPVCQTMYDRLDALVQSAFRPTLQPSDHGHGRRTVSIDTTLMWDILDYACARQKNKPGRGLFDPSFVQDARPTAGDEAHGRTVVETQIFHRPNPVTDVEISDGGQEFPPFSNTVRTSAANQALPAPADADVHERPASLDDQQLRTPNPDSGLGNPLWPAPEVLGNASVMDLMQDPFFQFHDSENPYAGFWEIGNL